jgi:hypothetical protein
VIARAATALAVALLLGTAFHAGVRAQVQPSRQPAPQPPAAPAKPSAAVLQGLDKITARVSAFKAPLGQAVRFGTLEILARACDKRPPEEPPESAAYLEIRELRPGEQPARIFAGWMFASSPALSALEHPVYDVWVVDCQ